MRTVNSELAELLDALEALDTSWCSLQQRWVGRYVMLSPLTACLLLVGALSM